MNGIDVALALAIVGLITGAGLMAVTETSLTRTTPAHAAGLVAEGRRGARALAELVAHPERFLNTVLLLALGCQLVAATLVGVLASRHLPPSGVALATAAEVVVVFVLAEAAPKSWAVVHGDRAALATAPVALVLARTAPLRALSGALVRLATTLLPGGRQRRDPLVSQVELLATADVAAAERTIGADERELIHSAVAFGDTVARDVMVPRDRVVAVDAGASVDDVLDLVPASGLSRLPAVDGDLDHVAGLLYAKDLLGAVASGRAAGPVRRLLRTAPTAAASEPVADLLRDMQRDRTHMVVLHDEHGAALGLVTLEDLIEELVGEIEDEHDRG